MNIFRSSTTSGSFLLTLLFLPQSIQAADFTWDANGIGPHNWHSPSNWTGGANALDIPHADDNVSFSLGESYTVETSRNNDVTIQGLNVNNGTLTLDVGKSLTASSMIVGQSGHSGGQLRLDGIREYSVGNVVVGQGATSSSSLTYSASWNPPMSVASSITIGGNSDGEMTVEGGRIVVGANVNVGASTSGVSGELTLTGNGTTLSANGALNVGSKANDSGQGKVQVLNGGHLVAASINIGDGVWPPGSDLLVDGEISSIDVAGEVSIESDGRLTVSNGAELTVEGPISGDGELVFHGGSLRALSLAPGLTGGLDWTSGGMLLESDVTIGGPSSPFANGLTVSDTKRLQVWGNLTVSGQTLSLTGTSSQPGISARGTILDGGTVHFDHGLSTGYLGNWGLISGHGTIDTPNDPSTPFNLRNGDSIQGTPSSQTIALTGYVTGSGSLQDVVIEGTIVGSGSLNQVVIEGALIGEGALNDVEIKGLHSPSDVGSGADTVSLNVGNLVYAPTATLHLDIANVEPQGSTQGSGYDQIHSVGELTLDGTIEVSLPESFVPSHGDSFALLSTTGDLSGAFANEILPALSGGLQLALNYDYFNNAVTLVVEGLVGDYNHDGVIDAIDYAVWRGALGQTGNGLAADADGNGVVDQIDYFFWRANYGNTTTPAPIATGVPEPSSVLLLLLSLAGLVPRRSTLRC